MITANTQKIWKWDVDLCEDVKLKILGFLLRDEICNNVSLVSKELLRLSQSATLKDNARLSERQITVLIEFCKTVKQEQSSYKLYFDLIHNGSFYEITESHSEQCYMTISSYFKSWTEPSNTFYENGRGTVSRCHWAYSVISIDFKNKEKRRLIDLLKKKLAFDNTYTGRDTPPPRKPIEDFLTDYRSITAIGKIQFEKEVKTIDISKYLDSMISDNSKNVVMDWKIKIDAIKQLNITPINLDFAKLITPIDTQKLSEIMKTTNVEDLVTEKKKEPNEDSSKCSIL